MTRMRLAPTRSNLLSVRADLKVAREGYEILDKKREVLTTELIHIAHRATVLQTRVWALLAEAYQALAIARLSMGREHLEWAALSVNETIEVKVQLRSIMGVVIPKAESSGGPPEMPYSLGDTTVALDEAAARFREVLAEVPELAEMLTTVWRLARELQKTQRRVNALQYIFIPQYETTEAFIESALEEREREETFRLKRLKSRAQAPMDAPAERESERTDGDGEGGRASSQYFG
ncbi:MAG: V-type ATP synthase subunit D [Anaerolineae bacterium]|jgi:V/A-type H+-transporting ATPase subunit D|nr:V-type ATP synthase subunit D [Anaerolineae bacterium]